MKHQGLADACRAALQHRNTAGADMQFVNRSAQIERGWESRVIDATHLVFDAHDGRFVLKRTLMPPSRWEAIASTAISIEPIHAVDSQASLLGNAVDLSKCLSDIAESSF